MTQATNLGFPRIGKNRELKKALEDYWTGKISPDQLRDAGRKLRTDHWLVQKTAGLSWIPSNDFSLYDHVLDTAVLAGAIPPRFSVHRAELDRYFAMARGGRVVEGARGAAALEMTKWFDTNYHYLVPELARGQEFHPDSDRPVQELLEARALEVPARPAILGPASFLLLAKGKEPGFDPLDLWPGLTPVYEELLRRLSAAGAEWVQLDEPCLVTDDGRRALAVLERIYGRLAAAAPSLKILIATYFGGLDDALPAVLGLPVHAVHLDLVRAPGQLEAALELAPRELVLSLGLVDGRNVWRADLSAALSLAERAAAQRGAERLMIAPSCSLLHLPLTLESEERLDREVKGWLAFATEKLAEVVLIARGIREGRAAISEALAESEAASERRRSSSRVLIDRVRRRLAEAEPALLVRSSPHSVRREAQKARTPLPLLPTTTIGSFPQTVAIRKARAAFKAGKLPASEYEAFLRAETARAVRWQEEVGLDVLVHGEFERNDMVEHFGERLTGFVFTSGGWVQSYGSRCVKPPIIFGDVERRRPMTIDWFRYAQSLTRKPLKGMLTGPVTLLKWSFVRDDQPPGDTCRQIAFAIRDEVRDLESAGAAVIQIDEPALREGLPLRGGERAGYLRWAVDAFRLASAGVRDETQVHTHMCYAEFNEIIDSIAELDADVISLEASRSQMELLGAFRMFRYPSQVGPGVYDIHSPFPPSSEDIEALLEKALAVLPADRLWVNPDCGLKTRRWEEVEPSILAMVDAARSLRRKLLARDAGRGA